VLREVNSRCLILHTPNVHTGDGFVLLRELLATSIGKLRWAQLDERARERLGLQPSVETHYVARTGAGCSAAFC